MLLHPNIDPVALALGPVKVHWYGLMYLCAFAQAALVAWHRAGQHGSPLKRTQIEDLVVTGAFGVILGGRCGYVLFYHFDAFLADPLWLLRIWEGGMSFHGGLLGVTLALWLYALRNGIAFLRLADFVAPMVPLGLACGRLGNFIGQELWGRATTVPWGVVFPRDPEGLVRHPSQLYQAALEGVLLFVVLYWYSRKPRPAGSVGAVFLIGYGVARFVVEYFRQPDSHIGFDFWGLMTRGQVLSLPMMIAGAALLYWFYQREQRSGPARA